MMETAFVIQRRFKTALPPDPHDGTHMSTENVTCLQSAFNGRAPKIRWGFDGSTPNARINRGRFGA